MSHVGNGEHDFDGLKVSEILDEETIGRIKQARIEARSIIDRLEPFHISSWADLLTKLDDCRETAIRNARLLDPAFREVWEMRQRDVELEESPPSNFFKAGVAGIAVLLFVTAILGSFTSLPSKTGSFVWWVVLPAAIIGVILFVIVPYLETWHELRPISIKLRKLLKERHKLLKEGNKTP